jgi:hypothetical protein
MGTRCPQEKCQWTEPLCLTVFQKDLTRYGTPGSVFRIRARCPSVGRHRTTISLWRYMAVSHQLRDEYCDLLDGLPHSEYVEPRQRGNATEAR